MKDCRPRAYIYPITSRSGGIPNPYIGHCIEALEEDFNILNRLKPSKTGIFDLILYFNKLDYIFLNWPEEIPGRKGDLIQVVFFMMMITWFRISRVKIVWTLHNKASHYEVRKRLKKYIIRFIARNANLIITHSREGVDLARELSGFQTKPVLFMHHPVLPLKPDHHLVEKTWDLLIWGTVAPYKGVDAFLEYVSQSDLRRYKILIAGKITKDWLKPALYKHRSDRVEIIDDYISAEALDLYIARSRIILFTYAQSSVLSSGVLMDTLIYKPVIIGPDFGAFKELAEIGLIYTYRDFNHLNELVPEVLASTADKSEKIREFCENHSWKDYSTFIRKTLLTGQ